MTWSSWWLFVVSTLFISATPGPNMLLAFQYGLNYGTRKTLYTLAGLSCGLLILLCLSIAGVSLLSTQMPVVFQAFKAVGAVYLLYLGWQAWHAQSAALEGPLVRVQPSRSRLFKVGLAVSLSNPKAILFFAAFFPQFVHHNQPQLPQYLILMASFFVIETLWQLIYVLSGRSLAQWLKQGRRLLYLNRSCAVIYALIAVGLLMEVARFFV